jgi:hypothetical protein
MTVLPNIVIVNKEVFLLSSNLLFLDILTYAPFFLLEDSVHVLHVDGCDAAKVSIHSELTAS